MDINIEDLRKGDRNAWTQAFEVLFAIGLSVCISSSADLNHQEQEDVVSEAIIRVLNNYVETVPSFEDCKKLVAAASRNRLLDYLEQRNAQKRGGGMVESLEQLECFDAPDQNQVRPDEDVVKGERALIVAKALQQIPGQYRKVVEDYYLKGFTQQEIAERNGLKIGSVGNYLDRGLKALAKILSKKELLL